jgi:hypothetical protein
MLGKFNPDQETYEEYLQRINLERPFNMAEGGQLVKPSVDGSRPGYQGREKYVTPLRRKGFTGSKFTSVPDPTYSDGRRRVKTKAYKEWLKKEHAKPKPKYMYEKTIRDELDNYLIDIAEAMREADNTQDFEHLMRNNKETLQLEKETNKSRKKRGLKEYKLRRYNKGMLNRGAIKILEKLEQDPVSLKIIAESLGEDTDWVLDIIDERSQYVEDVKRERKIASDDPKYTKPRNDYLKVENWMQKNAKRYASPETFEKALIKRFGKDNQFIKDMSSSKKSVQTFFSDGFKKTMLNADPASGIKPSHLKQLISSSLYNYNDKIKAQLTDEINKIFTSENIPKLRTEARKMIKNNPLFKKFGLDQTITGPFPRVIQAEIGKKLWDDFRAFRHPRANTYEILKAFEDLVPPEFKGMFKESASAVLDAQQNKWPEAKNKLGIADKVAWDHKVPASIIDKGYADIIEYTKVNPVDYEWNSRLKNAKFDTPINRLITKFENAENIRDKKKIVEEMITTKNKFSEKWGGYLDEVNINFNDKTGELKFSSSAKPFSKKMDAVAMLKKSQEQILSNFWCPTGKASGGRIGFANGSGCPDSVKKKNFLKMTSDVSKGKITGKAADQIAKNAGKVIAKAGSKSALASIFGPAGIGIDLAYEVGSIGFDMATDSNVSLKQALQNNWLTGAFIKGTGQEEYHKGLVKFDSSSKPMAQIQNLMQKIESEEKQLERIKTDLVRGDYTGEAKKEKIAQQEAVIKNLYKDFDKVARRKNEGPRGENVRYLALEEGSPEQSAYDQAKQEYDSIGEAKAALKKTSEHGFKEAIKSSRAEPWIDYSLSISPQYGKLSKKEIDDRLRQIGDYYGYGYTPHGLGFGMQQMQPGIGDMKYDEDLGYREISDIMTTQDAQDKIATFGGIANMAGGGIASIRRPKAIPPKAGPMPDASGLSTLYNRVKRI